VTLTCMPKAWRSPMPSPEAKTVAVVTIKPHPSTFADTRRVGFATDEWPGGDLPTLCTFSKVMLPLPVRNGSHHASMSAVD
jgi:hypothetical protein